MKKVYRVGYVGLLDDAPLHVALSLGLFGDEGFSVELSCELGWAALTSKLANGHLAAANVSALYPLLPSLGHQHGAGLLEVVAMTSFSGLTITLATDLAAALKNKIRLPNPLRIGVAVPRGDAHVVLNAWQKSGALSQNESMLVPIAASQFLDALAEGYVHGFITSDPISSQAEQSGKGTAVARSHEFFPYHPRSVMAVRAPLVGQDPEFCTALKAVLQKARAHCARPANWPAVQELLNRDWHDRGGNASREPRNNVFTGSLPAHAFFEKPTSSRQELDATGVDFLRRACFATDPSYRDHDVRSAIQKIYRHSLENVPPSSELRPAFS